MGTIRGYYECKINYLGEFLKAKGLEDAWTDRMTELQQVLSDWKGCDAKNVALRYLYAVSQFDHSKVNRQLNIILNAFPIPTPDVA